MCKKWKDILLTIRTSKSESLDELLTNPSLLDIDTMYRKSKSEMLGSMLTNLSLQNIETIYQFSYTEATNKNLDDILKYIDKRNYFMLSRISNRIPYYEDELGTNFDANLYEVYLIIDKQKQYHFAVVYVQLINEYLAKLITVKKVNRFFHQLFSHKDLIYPIKYVPNTHCSFF